VVDDIVIKVEQVSKKYCKSLKRSMLYGIEDIGRNMVGLSSRSDRLRKNEFWAVDDVSFELKKGETLGIIGPNGSGKTTLLKMLNGIFWPDKGKITVKGRVGALIEIGAGFHPLLTGRENIYINAAILGMTKKEVDSKFNDFVEFADIGDSLDTPVKFYSSGMFVRLGFAVAIHCRPDILLVDEILAVGDTDFRRKSADRMKDLITNNDCSIILVSHNMHSVTAIANKAILLNNGAILASGDVKNVVAQYDLMMRPGGKKKYSMSVFIDSE
jgi:lipopolysaccharide transport system ATP-binding protein